VTRLILIQIHTCDTTHSNTHSHVWHDSFEYTFTRVTRLIHILIHVCDMTQSHTHSHVRHDSFYCVFTFVTWLIPILIHTCDTTYALSSTNLWKKLTRSKRQSSSGSAIMRHELMNHLQTEICADYAFYAASSERRGSTDPWGHYESSPILQVYFR